MLNRISKLALVGLCTLAVACGDDDENSKNNSTNNGTTTTNNGTTTTNNGTTTTNNGTTAGTNNDTNNNTTAATQCTAVGQTCVAGDPTNAGFVCGDDGLGAKCLRACTPPADGEAYPCTSGQICSAFEQGGATACVPSQCAGFQDAAGCDKYEFPNGGLCFGTDNDNFLCFPAGEKTEGVACTEVDECASGLLCSDDVCTKICANDAACTGTGERCVGDTDPDFLNAGAGFCQIGCDSYSTGQCPAGTGCLAVTETDGICLDDTGTGGPGATCVPAVFDANDVLVTPSTGCLGGLTCLSFGDGVASCAARCNGAADSQTASDASCPTTNGPQYCLNLADAGEESPNSGVCLDQCTVADYGADPARCTAEGFTCGPFRGERHVCLPGGDKAIGATCVAGECAEGSYCLTGGDGNGTCTSFCDQAATPNALLSCATGETCEPLGNAAFAFGRCGFSCDTPFADTDCPAGLQNCFVEGNATTGFCGASGSIAIGAPCLDPTSELNNCVGGAVCANSFSITPFEDSSVFDSDGVCTQACRFAGGANQCGAGNVCGADFLTFSTGTGICETLGTNQATTASGAACPDAGKACGPNSICVDQGNGTNACFTMCEVGSPNNRGCADGDTCNDVFGGLPLGLCQ